RRMDDASLLALGAADRGYLLVPAELRACAAAARVAAVAAPHCPSLATVVRGPAPGGLPAKAVAQALGLPLAGSLRAEPRLAGAPRLPDGGWTRDVPSSMPGCPTVPACTRCCRRSRSPDRTCPCAPSGCAASRSGSWSRRALYRPARPVCWPPSWPPGWRT